MPPARESAKNSEAAAPGRAAGDRDGGAATDETSRSPAAALAAAAPSLGLGRAESRRGVDA
eukprot:CAMPEP_0198536664 /NCGR_PEP_ID=MMETSP1462-20131121/42870_1 /TAXON_ID=1333877 /ORGANISM="Brandtodinium nutriculum, Strain RCC3387" /LENGTH=60 /DNA_ID=CAMNT_0044266625 /DNA_START=25 /DNA_END=205 /DNA_ORIENTATION=+